MTTTIKTYYLALNKQTKQYFIGYSKLKPWYSFRYEHKKLANAGEYKDYSYYQFNDLDDLIYALDNNYGFTFKRWHLLNNQISIREHIQQYLNDRDSSYLFIRYEKTQLGYVFLKDNELCYEYIVDGDTNE